jgi:hypothetical protein
MGGGGGVRYNMGHGLSTIYEKRTYAIRGSLKLIF